MGVLDPELVDAVVPDGAISEVADGDVEGFGQGCVVGAVGCEPPGGVVAAAHVLECGDGVAGGVVSGFVDGEGKDEGGEATAAVGGCCRAAAERGAGGFTGDDEGGFEPVEVALGLPGLLAVVRAVFLRVGRGVAVVAVADVPGCVGVGGGFRVLGADSAGEGPDRCGVDGG